MGYQESLLKVNKSNQKNFIKEVCNIPKENWDIFCEPVSVIEMKKNIPDLNLKKGDKLLYISGERDGQRNIKSFLLDYYDKSKVAKKLNFSYNFIPIEYCEDHIECFVRDGERKSGK